MINYAVVDLMQTFSVSEAAALWCEISRITDDNKAQFFHMRSALVDAIRNDQLAAEVPQKIVEKRMRGGLYDIPEPDYENAVIKRKALKGWAKQRNQKPKFLFPEMRVEALPPHPATTIPPEKAVKDSPARQSQLDKVACQAIARVLWQENPARTIADIVADSRIRTLGNGVQYKEKTLHEWLSEVDPRTPEQKTGRPRKVPEEAE